MLAKHNNKLSMVYVWDWKETPNFTLLFKAIKEMNWETPIFTEVDTNSDDLAIVVSEIVLTNEDTRNIYMSYYNDSLDENGVWIKID